MSISRRDFLNGVALTVAAGITPEAQIAAQPAHYPPALTGLRGHHAGSSARDIAAITVNRWSHGYSYVANSLFDRDDYTDVLKEARRTVGRVAIANTDAGGDAWAHYAIDQAERAVRELVS